ncbi:MAG TPA: sodium/solute symporter [Vicinamibacterales bacterium]|nr:sodium/solute symporter [Vicinamibacterales bacterium]
MTWLADHWVVLLLLAAYGAMLVRHAWEGARGTRGVADYYVGGRRMGGIALGLSFFATYSSTNSFVGFAGQSYAYGAPWLLLAPMIVVFCVLAWTVIAPRLRTVTQELGSLTIPDFIGFRFDSRAARVLAAAIVLFSSFFYLTAVFKGAGTTLAAFLDVGYQPAVWIFFAIVMAYTAVGGFISVVKTDAVQGVIMIAAALLLFGGTVSAAGGIGALGAVSRMDASRHLFTWDAAMPFPVLLGVLISGTIKLVVEPRQLSRFYALRDARAVRHGAWIATLSFLAVYALLVPIGLYARVIYPDGVPNTDAIVPMLLTRPDIFHPAVSAFMLVALVAAAMSSVDSVLLVMAATFHRDLVALVRPARTDRAAVRATAAYVALFALVTTLIALNPPGEIVTLTSFSGSLYAGCFLPVLLFGLYSRRGDGRAAIASMAAGLFALLAWKPFGPAAVHEVFPAMAVSLTAYLLFAAAARRDATSPRSTPSAPAPSSRSW